MSPYFGTDILSFFGVLFSRVGQPLVADEIQLLVLLLSGIAGSIVGSLLMLKKSTMVANSLSHTILLGIAVVFLLSKGSTLGLDLLLLASLITGVATTLATQLLQNLFRLQKDASIGLVFTTFFALGIVLITALTKNAHIGVELIMGNIDAATTKDLLPLGVLALTSILAVSIFYEPLKVIIFDPLFALGAGLPVTLARYGIMILTSTVAIASFRSIGVFLFLALVIAPPMTARLFTNSLRGLIVRSVALSSMYALISVALSRHILSVYELPLSTSGIYVTLAGFGYLVSIPVKVRFAKTLRLEHA